MSYNGAAASLDVVHLLDAHEERIQRVESSIQQLATSTAIQGTKIDLLVGKLDKFVDTVDDKTKSQGATAAELRQRVHDLEGESKRRNQMLRTLVWIGGTIATGVIIDLVVHIIEHYFK